VPSIVLRYCTISASPFSIYVNSRLLIPPAAHNAAEHLCVQVFKKTSIVKQSGSIPALKHGLQRIARTPQLLSDLGDKVIRVTLHFAVSLDLQGVALISILFIPTDILI
jgi:hypothetical protein